MNWEQLEGGSQAHEASKSAKDRSAETYLLDVRFVRIEGTGGVESIAVVMMLPGRLPLLGSSSRDKDLKPFAWRRRASAPSNSARQVTITSLWGFGFHPFPEIVRPASCNQYDKSATQVLRLEI